MNNSWYFILPGTLLVLASALPVTSYAEITLLKADPQKDDLLSRLNFQVGGSIRPQLNHMTSGKGKTINVMCLMAVPVFVLPQITG